MNKFFIAIIIAIIVVGGYFIFKKSPEQTPQESVSPLSVEKASVASTAEEKVIIYTDAGYSPSPLEINIEDIVVFKNNSSQSMWPASSRHPSHDEYPTTGGCLGSAFDACKAVQSGDSWSFKFDISGTWKYHDHLHSSDFGTIIVQ